MAFLTKKDKSEYNFSGTSTSMFLSLDLMTEVFVRLPIESIVQLKLVCKQWNSLISSLEFAKLHQQHAINNPNHNPSLNLFILRRPSKRIKRLYTFRTESQVLEETNLLSHNKLPINSYPIGSSNGLICFHSGYITHSLYICNPAIEEYRYIARPCLAGRPIALYWGFGYDSLSDDYKIVLLGKVSRQAMTTFACVFTMRTNQWKQIECPSHDEMGEFMEKNIDKIKPSSLPVLMGHTLYWRVDDRFNSMNLLAFNLRTESFEIVPLPSQNPGIDKAFFICQLRQSLCACWVWYEWVVDGNNKSSRLCMEVWKMECRSNDIVWKPMIKFERVVSCLPGGGPILPKLFELEEHGKYMIVYSDFMTQYVIDTRTELEHVVTPKHLRLNSVLDSFERDRQLFVLDYTQSLVSPTHYFTPSVEVRGVKRRRNHRFMRRNPMLKYFDEEVNGEEEYGIDGS